ncbi:MAG: NAD-dependent epimerase/dehydratase family protein [Psychrobacillus sp.]
MTKRTAIVVGATGFTGQFLVKQLCESEEYTAVSIIVRRIPDFNHPKLDVRVRDFDRLEEKDLEIADDLFCCLGTTIKKAKSKEMFQKVDLEYPLQIASLAKKRGIPNFHVISAVGSNIKSPFFYSQVKGRLEKELIALNLQSLSIFKPSLIIGGREEFRLGERLSEGLFKILNPVLKGPFKKMRAVEGRQLAFAMYHYAIHGKKDKLNVYQNKDILNATPIKDKEEPPISREELFNWEKREGIFVEKENDK